MVERPNEVFLSHSSANRRFARKVAGILRAHGVPVWYSERSIKGAEQWHDEIGKALRRCDWFMILLTTKAVGSEWVKRELLYVLDDERYNGRIVPLHYRTCDYNKLSWVLGGFEFIDLRRNQKEGFRELLRIWGIGYNPA